MAINFFDQQYLDLTLQVLKDNLKDLEAWNAHNDDKFTIETSTINVWIKSIEDQIALDKRNEEFLEQGLHNDFTPWPVDTVTNL